MLLKFRILAPYQYVYGEKKSWLLANEFLHLDTNTQKEEIKAILSPTYQYRDYIHLDKTNIPSDVLDEFISDSGGIPLADGDFDKPTPLDIAPKKFEEEDETPVEYIGDNYFSKQIEENKVTIEQAEAEAKAQVEEPISETEESEPEITESEPISLISEVEETEEQIIEEEVIEEDDDGEVISDMVGGTQQEELRREELAELHWQKLKDIAETYEIEYTQKDEVIDLILEKEFE